MQNNKFLFLNHDFKFINSFIQKGDKGTRVTKPSHYLPLDPSIPSHVQGACDSTIVPHAVFVKFEQILKFMSEHITALNLVLNKVQPKFSSLLRRVSESLKFSKSSVKFINLPRNFKIPGKFHSNLLSNDV